MFSRSSFSPVSFSLISFHGAQQQPTQQDGRSGYWRLYFTNLQEEALKKKNAQVAAVKDAPKTVKAAPKKPKRTKKTVVREVATPKPTAPIIPFKKLPTKLEPNAFDMLAELPPLVAEQYVFSLRASKVIINFAEEKAKRKAKRRKLAALLLLAA